MINEPLVGQLQFAGLPVWAFVDSENIISEVNEENNLLHSGRRCGVDPVVGQFNPRIEWSRSSFNVLPTYNNVMMTPAVVDLDANGIPDIVFNTFPGGAFSIGITRAVRGDDGTSLWTITNPAYRVIGQSDVSVGDIDLDGRPEILATHEAGGIMAFEHDGTFKSHNHAVRFSWNFACGGVSIADLDQDGIPEIIAGVLVLNNDGTLRWNGALSGGIGSADNGGGSLSTVADIDLDGSPEVVAGRSAYRADGSLYWNVLIADGFPGVGDFDTGPFAEIVLIASSQIFLLEHTGAIKWGPILIPGRGGAPTIADMDGDGDPEIGGWQGRAGTWYSKRMAPLNGRTRFRISVPSQRGHPYLILKDPAPPAKSRLSPTLMEMVMLKLSPRPITIVSVP